MAAYQRLCQQVTYEVITLPADLLAIATQKLVNDKYRAVKSYLAPTHRKGKSEQDFAA
jgi:hypothetical protein